MELHNDASGVNICMRGGQNTEGDGQHAQAGVNFGLPLDSNGFINAKLEW